jgi:hypothetical protein
MMRIPMKGILRAVKPREESPIPNNIKPNETKKANSAIRPPDLLLALQGEGSL